MKKILLTVLILFAVALSPALSYAKNSNINSQNFKMEYAGHIKQKVKDSKGYPIGTIRIRRLYDPQTNVVCYYAYNVFTINRSSNRSNGFSCVYLGKK